MWEYRTEVLPLPTDMASKAAFDEALNGFGKLGWEMVGAPLVVPAATSRVAAAAGQAQAGLFYSFKRPVIHADRSANGEVDPGAARRDYIAGLGVDGVAQCS